MKMGSASSAGSPVVWIGGKPSSEDPKKVFSQDISDEDLVNLLFSIYHLVVGRRPSEKVVERRRAVARHPIARSGPPLKTGDKTAIAQDLRRWGFRGSSSNNVGCDVEALMIVRSYLGLDGNPITRKRQESIESMVRERRSTNGPLWAIRLLVRANIHTLAELVTFSQANHDP